MVHMKKILTAGIISLQVLVFCISPATVFAEHDESISITPTCILDDTTKTD